MTSKYKVGEHVVIDKVFIPTRTKDGSNYDSSRGKIIVEVIRVDKTVSMGYCYQLKSPDNIDLGGIMYWEEDIRKVLTDAEDNLWKAWGDK